MSDYDSILFDFDGVLADTEPMHFRCWGQVLAGFGVELPWDYYARNCIGTSEHDTLQAFLTLASPPIPFDTLWAQYPRKKELFRSMIAESVPLAEGARELLEELRGRFRMAVVSLVTGERLNRRWKSPGCGATSTLWYAAVRRLG